MILCNCKGANFHSFGSSSLWSKIAWWYSSFRYFMYVFRVFLRPGPLANFRAGPGYPKFISTDRVIILLHAPALLATASASVYVLYSTRLCYSSDPKDCAFGIRHSAHICMSSRRSLHSNAHPSWRHADVCGVSNAECTILSIGAWISS